MTLLTDSRERLAHPPSAYGSIGAAAAAAKLWKLPSAQTANALGLAATMAAGPAGAIKAGTGEYHYLKGTVAIHAHLATQLAQAGAPVNPLALEGPGGFYRIWSAIPTAELAAFDVATDLANYVSGHWVAPELFFKRYPVNYFNQEFIAQADRIAKDNGLTAAAITAIRIRIGSIPAEVGGLTGAPFGERSRAMMATRFGVACMLARGRVTLADTLSPDGEDVLQLVEKAEIEASSGDAAFLEIDADGQTYGGTLTPAQRDFRLTESEICEIGQGIATPVLDESKTQQLIELLLAIENIPEISQVVTATLR
jgi:2-methylcitrate dehydratase PrpD